MTVSTTTNRISYTGDGASVAFTVPFLFLANTDIAVYVNGVEITTGFTTTGAGDGSGTVTFVVAPTAGAALVLVRDPDFLQRTSLPSNGPFPSTSVERMADKSMIGIQRLSDQVSRALTIGDGESAIDMTLPAVAERSLHLLSFDATGIPKATTFTEDQVATAVAAAYGGGTAAAGVTVLQVGIGAVSMSMQALERSRCLETAQFGATLDGTAHLLSTRFATLAAAQVVYPFATSLSDTIDWAAIQACCNAAILAGKSVWHSDGHAVVNKKVSKVGWCDHYGTGTVTMTSATQALFEVTINTTTVDLPHVVGPTFIGPQTTNALSVLFHFLGDNTSYFQHGYFRFSVNGFSSWCKDDKATRTTTSGQEAMLNWNVWDITALNQGVAGYYGAGSGTGNEWRVNGLSLYAGASILKFDGVGCVVGDIIASGHWGCQQAGGVGIDIGAGTVYRANIDGTGIQFDANCDIPLKLPNDGIRPVNIRLGCNNYGGNTTLGAYLQPLYYSNIEDRDASGWKVGRSVFTSVVGVGTFQCFDLTFASQGSATVKIVAAGVVGGVSSCTAVSEYDIRENGAGALVVTGPFNNRAGGAGTFAISITTSGKVARVKVSYTSVAGNTLGNVTLTSDGFDGFKAERV